jgi:hypothetical protein
MKNRLLIFTLLISGCATQRAYDRLPPGAQTATVIAHGVSLIEVNGRQIGSTTSAVEVLAGQSEIRLKVDSSNFNAGDNTDRTYRLLLQAEPGKEYIITGRRGNGRLCAFPKDEATGQPNLLAPAGCITSEKAY